MAWYDTIEGLSQMALPVTIERGKPAPVDKYSLFDTYADAENFVKTHAAAYVGALIYIKTEDEEGQHHLGAYTVDAIGEHAVLNRLATTTASGDLTADVATLKAQVATLNGEEGTAGSVKHTAKGYADAVKTAVDASINELKAKDTEIDSSITELKNAVKNVAVYDLKAVDSPDGQWAAQYNFTKDSSIVTTINIPKDQFLKTASFVASASEEDKQIDGNVVVGDPYLKFEWQLDSHATTYVPVKSLVTTMTGDGKYITVTSNKISLNFEQVKTDIKAVIDPSIAEVQGKVEALEQKVDSNKADVDASLNALDKAIKDNKAAADASLNKITEDITNIDASISEIKAEQAKAKALEVNGVKAVDAGDKLTVTVGAANIKIGKAIASLGIEATDAVDVGFDKVLAKIEALPVGVESVEALDTTVTVDSSETSTPKIKVNISATADNALTAKGDGLFVEQLQWGTIA